MKPHEAKRFQISLVAIAVLGFAHTTVAASESSGLAHSLREKVTFGISLQPQYDALSSELEIDGNKTTLESDRLFFRRAFLGAKAKLSERWRTQYLTDVSDHWVENQIVRLEWKASARNTFRFGYEKMPFGYEDTTSSSKVKPIERSANTRFWNEVVGVGSYHSGVQLFSDLGHGFSSVVVISHNVKSDSAWPDIANGEFASYVRIDRKGHDWAGRDYLLGIDVARRASSRLTDLTAASLHGWWRIGAYELSAEATTGRIAPQLGDAMKPVGWHAQASRFIGEAFELVARYSQVEGDGYGMKIGSLIRKAPNSGYKYDRVDSWYCGLNYTAVPNRLTLSVGYEYGTGANAVRTADYAKETVNGFRLRGIARF